MSESDYVKRTSISNANTLEEIAAYWDTNSLADHWDKTYEVEFKVRAKQRRRVTVPPPCHSRRL